MVLWTELKKLSKSLWKIKEKMKFFYYPYPPLSQNKLKCKPKPCKSMCAQHYQYPVLKHIRTTHLAVIDHVKPSCWQIWFLLFLFTMFLNTFLKLNVAQVYCKCFIVTKLSVWIFSAQFVFIQILSAYLFVCLCICLFSSTPKLSVLLVTVHCGISWCGCCLFIAQIKTKLRAGMMSFSCLTSV